MSNCLSFIKIQVIKAEILETSLDNASDLSLRQNDILDCERISAWGIFFSCCTYKGYKVSRQFLGTQSQSPSDTSVLILM